MRWFAVSLLLWAGAAFGQPAQTLPDEKIREIEKLISAEMSRQSIPGMSIAVASGDTVLWSNGYGLSDLENFVPAKRSTVYRLASLSKPITAVGILQLVEAGKVDLDAPIQKYLPDFPAKPWPITTRQLLGHLGGIRHYRDDTEAFDTRHFGSLTEAVRTFQADPLVAEPGTKYSYTTYGFVVLGAILEKAAGSTYIQYLQEHVFRPAGMNTIRTDDVYSVIPNRARGYSRDAAGFIHNAALSDTSIKIPGGGMVSTPEDLVNFAMSIHRSKLLRADTVERMFTSQTTRAGPPTYYGMGWGIGQIAGHPQFSHTGGQAGVSTVLRYLPADKIAIAMMFNLEQVKFEPLADAIVKIVGGF